MKTVLTLFLLFAFVLDASDDNYYYDNAKKVLLKPVVSTLRTTTDVDYYENEAGIKMGVSDKLLVQFKETTNLQAYLLEYNATVVKIIGKNLYLLKVSSKQETLSVANRLSEKEDVLFAHPDFLKSGVLR